MEHAKRSSLIMDILYIPVDKKGLNQGGEQVHQAGNQEERPENQDPGSIGAQRHGRVAACEALPALLTARQKDAQPVDNPGWQGNDFPLQPEDAAALDQPAEGQEIQIEQLIRPVSTFLVPIFFVMMGIQVRLETFVNLPILGLAAGLTIAAIIGKQICGLGVLDRGLDRLSIGVGMIPRGEVGLIFASIGKALNVVDDATYSAIVIMVIVTTLITPPAMKWTLGRRHP